MKIEEFESYLKKIHPDLYSFSFILIPDDLQASQLIVDGLSYVLMNKRSIFDRLINKSQNFSIELDDFKMNLYKAIYEIAQKRFLQIRTSVETKDLDNFYSLEFDERAVIFLRQKLKFSHNDICFTVSLGKDDLMKIATQARNKLVLSNGHDESLQGLHKWI